MSDQMTVTVDPLELPAGTVHIDTRQRILFMAVRQALLIVLGAIEDYLDLERSVTPKHQRK